LAVRTCQIRFFVRISNYIFNFFFGWKYFPSGRFVFRVGRKGRRDVISFYCSPSIPQKTERHWRMGGNDLLWEERCWLGIWMKEEWLGENFGNKRGRGFNENNDVQKLQNRIKIIIIYFNAKRTILKATNTKILWATPRQK